MAILILSWVNSRVRLRLMKLLLTIMSDVGSLASLTVAADARQLIRLSLGTVGMRGLVLAVMRHDPVCIGCLLMSRAFVLANAVAFGRTLNLQVVVTLVHPARWSTLIRLLPRLTSVSRLITLVESGVFENGPARVERWARVVVRSAPDGI